MGHNVITASELNLSRATDEDILRKAKEMNRILITRDKDFGALTFLRDDIRSGVILLRINPSNLEEVHSEIARVLEKHTFGELLTNFCVIEPGRHRLRRLY